MWKSHTPLRLDIKRRAPLTSRVIEATYASPCSPDKQQEKERHPDTAVHQNAHSWTHTYTRARTHTHADEEQTSKQRRNSGEDAPTDTHPTEAGRSFSTSQGQWHTSPWIITLSHSASRQRITSCTETSAGGGGRRQRKGRLEGKARRGRGNKQHTHASFYASSVRQPVVFLKSLARANVSIQHRRPIMYLSSRSSRARSLWVRTEENMKLIMVCAVVPAQAAPDEYYMENTSSF